MTKSIIAILTILSLLSCSKIKNDKNLELKIRETILSGKKEISLKSLTDFRWDNLLILTPYSRIEKIEEKFQVDLSNVENSGIESREDITILIFLLNKNAVRTVEYPRYPGDFARKGLKLIPCDSAIFNIKFTELKNNSGDKWIELVLQ